MNRYYYQRSARPRAPEQAPQVQRQTVYTLSGLPLAMAYVPFQNWEEPMSAERALKEGTAFESLVMPFEGGRR